MLTLRRTSWCWLLVAAVCAGAAGCSQGAADAPHLDGYRMEHGVEAINSSASYEGGVDRPIIACNGLMDFRVQAAVVVADDFEHRERALPARLWPELCGYAQHAARWLDEDRLDGDPTELAVAMHRDGPDAVLESRGTPEDAQMYVETVRRNSAMPLDKACAMLGISEQSCTR